jgi:hypothetical protein
MRWQWSQRGENLFCLAIGGTTGFAFLIYALAQRDVAPLFSSKSYYVLFTLVGAWAIGMAMTYFCAAVAVLIRRTLKAAP